MYLTILYGKTDEEGTERKVFDLKKDLVIDMGKFKMKVAEISDDTAKFIIFDKEGLKDNQNVELKGTKIILIEEVTEITLKVDENYKIYLNTMEDWMLWVKKGENPNKGVYDQFNENRRKLNPNAIPVTNAEEFRKALEEEIESDKM